jgi:BTB/POZ domain
MEVTLEPSDLPIGEETTLEETFAKFLTDPCLADIALEGTDGVRVPANHFVLAARSTVFHSMLLGGFAEASKEVVPIGYQSSVLRAIVEYVLTNTAEILQSVTAKKDATKEDVIHVQALMELAEAAIYFNLPMLCQKAFRAVTESLANVPLLSFLVLEACQKESPSIPKFKALAMSRIFFISPEDLNSKAVSILSEDVLEDLLKGEKNEIDELLLFEILRVWSNEPHRKACAVGMMKFIHLEWIDTDIIATTVASSGLVSTEQLLGVYRKQALAAHAMHGRIFKKSRHELIWKKSGTEISKGRDILNYPPMTSGVYQWTCEVANTGGYNWLGVVANKDLDLERSLRDQEGVFLFSGHEGMAYTTTDEHHLEATYNLPTFGAEKSRVTLILDLEDEKSGGRLSASVNGGEPCVLFERMRSYCNDKNKGFVPFVSSRCPDGEVRVIEVIKLRSRQLANPAP